MTPLLWIGGVLVVTLVVCITIIDTTLKTNPRDKETVNFYHIAVEAYFIHRRGIWSKQLQRYVGACPHCRVYAMPRWVGTGKEEA